MSSGKIAVFLFVATITPLARAEIHVCQAPDGRKIVTNEECEQPFVATRGAIADIEVRKPAPALEALQQKKLEELRRQQLEKKSLPEEKLRLEKAQLQELQRLKQTNRPLETERLTRGQK